MKSNRRNPLPLNPTRHSAYCPCPRCQGVITSYQLRVGDRLTSDVFYEKKGANLKSLDVLRGLI